MPNSVYFGLGLTLGAVNTLRHRALGYRRPRPFDTSDPMRAAKYAIKVVDRWQERGGIDPGEQRVLEIGPGPDLATGAVLLQRGAKSYAAVDINPLITSDRSDVYGALRRLGGADYDERRMTYSVDAFPHLPKVSGSFDLIVSNATLEHVDDVEGLFRRLSVLAAPGCVMCHHVDANTHMRWLKDRDPLNILRYPPKLYGSLLRFPGAPNRLRATDYVKIAERTGWKCSVIPGRQAQAEYVTRVRSKLAPQFRDRAVDDLALLSFTLRTTR